MPRRRCYSNARWNRPHHHASDSEGKGFKTGTRRALWKCRSYGKPGNPKAGFPPFPQLLGNLARAARFPHSHSPGCFHRESRKPGDGEEMWTVEKWKSKNRIPTFPPPRQPAAQGTKSIKTNVCES